LSTRLVIAVAQMLWSALLIHLTGGRIETHFHVFGSLAFLAFYRDWRVLLAGTVVVASDHLIRQIFWPESVYGIVNPEAWRFLEHAFWVVFEDIVLLLGCFRGLDEMRNIAARHADVEALSTSERHKSAALELALAEVNQSQEALVRSEKLAAIGQLAASVGHELRNPLAAIRNAQTYLSRKLSASSTDAKVPQLLDVMDRELTASSKIIGDLLDFARERPLALGPCPLKPLVDEAVGLVPARGNVRVFNGVPDDIPVPQLDKEQFRQILINLVQNAVEAMPPERGGEVKVTADGGGDRLWAIRVEDNGVGIAKDTQEKIFQPLFTTKLRGTGLGLAIVSGVVKKHQGAIRVDSELGRGTRFTIELPAGAPAVPKGP
jgi:two-component system, NtrC family, sensor histidine kinase HydH